MLNAMALAQQSSQGHINKSAVMVSNTNEQNVRLTNSSEQSYSQEDLTLFLRYLKTCVQQNMSKEDLQQKVSFEYDIYCCNHEPLSIGREVLMEVINHNWVSASVISLYIRFLYYAIITHEQKDRFAFLDPHQLAVYDKTQDKMDEKSKYMSDVFQKKRKRGTLFLAPYNSKQHWVLLAINPVDEIVYYLDSRHGDPGNYPELKEFVNNALEMFRSSPEATQPENKQSEWRNINVPKQPNDIDCGYYVMRFMWEVIATNSDMIPDDYIPEFKCTSYSQNELQQTKEEWAQYVFEILSFSGIRIQVPPFEVLKQNTTTLDLKPASVTGPEKPKMTLDKKFELLEDTRVKLEGNYRTSKSKIQTVSFYIRERESNENYYSPKLISFGPIHHGDPKLNIGEQYKLMWTSMYAEARSVTPQDLHQGIANDIEGLRKLFSWDELRHEREYSNEDLAWMLFVDGCSVLQIMEKVNNSMLDEYLKVKLDILHIVERDLFLLENQLPYQLLKLLNSNEKELKKLMYDYCDFHNMFTAFESPKILQGVPSSSPTHLLDYLRTNILGIGMETTHKDEQKRSSQSTLCPSFFGVNVSQRFVLVLPKLQKMFTFMRKKLHEKKRNKTSSLPKFGSDTERGNQSSPPPPPTFQTQSKADKRSKKSQLNFRKVVLKATAHDRYNKEVRNKDKTFIEKKVG